MQFIFQHTAEVYKKEWIEVELTVTAEYTPESKGSRGQFGEPEEPDEPAQIEILSCVDSEGNEYEPDEIPGIFEAANDEYERISGEYEYEADIPGVSDDHPCFDF